MIKEIDVKRYKSRRHKNMVELEWAVAKSRYCDDYDELYEYYFTMEKCAYDLCRATNEMILKQKGKSNKKPYVDDLVQKVASDILTEFMFAKNMDEVDKAWKRLYKQYQLNNDPFTHTPCSDEDYAKSKEEYEGN